MILILHNKVSKKIKLLGDYGVGKTVVLGNELY